ncbi:patatin-like phospholipase family protein [Rhodoferax sp. AJA081-3]|uniref:patatin-like phospholipase family protein n=1 Tax=Rhodoferax sp. AJA081-3 TaxID=2752316 RepID=UPI001ADECB6E|nr:patatin-like phospholipase family protein [Rhodoferax sp. AJA081-3]QTN26383.1 patatin-like phospholipase family protein [Rhodoferax sp. AJA081-3]
MRYQQCMVMAGGGFRFGIYLGMYAAARDAGQAPDLVLASCGGAIAAALIHREPDVARQKAWLASPEMYNFWAGITPAPTATLGHVLAGVARRALDRRAAPRVPDLFNHYLHTLPPLPALPQPATPPAQQRPDVALVGSRLLYTAAEVGQPRGQRKLFAQTVFCQARAAQLVDGMPAPLGGAQWGNSAVAPVVATDTTMPLDVAARISVSDMYYFACLPHAGDHYMGGVVDLFPIELAQRLAHRVVMEFKAPFDQLMSVPAWRAVLGTDANQRLRQVHAQHADVWIDTSDIMQALDKPYMRNVLAWRQNRVRLEPMPPYAAFVQHMDDHWNYGYARGREAFARDTPSSQEGMRLVNRYNRL